MSVGRRKPVTMVMATKLLLGRLWSGLNYYDYYVSEHRPNPQPPFKFTLRHFPTGFLVFYSIVMGVLGADKNPVHFTNPTRFTQAYREYIKYL